MDDYVVGVDGCRDGWLICRYTPAASRIEFDVGPSFADILQCEAHARFIAIDIPIGLTEDGRARRCDLEARRILSAPRASSVFPVPARCLLKESSYAAACARSQNLSGKRISKQSFAIFPKIAEVDIRMTPEIQRRVFEVHPEVCFWAARRCPMKYGKKTPEGYDERRQILSAMLPYTVPDRRNVWQFGLDVQPDDLLDALIASVTAHRIYLGLAERLPRSSELDSIGLRMEMVY